MLRVQARAPANADEARADLQSRLASLFKLMFWSFATLLAFLAGLYWCYPVIAPKHNAWVYRIGLSGVAIMGVIWRGVLVRRPLRRELLHAIDMFYATGSGTAIAAAAVISQDRHFSAYTCLIYACDAVLARALIVPSSGSRTAVASSLAFVPMMGAAIWLAAETEQEVSGPAFVVGFVVVAVVAVLVSAAGSNIIYGLRRKAKVAQQLGQYRTVKLIGKGGLGEVYLADHVLLRRATAVKLLRPDRVGADNLARFEHEVQETSQLSHPNTVAVFDYGHSDGVFYYAMEYIDGVNLDELVRQHGPQRPARVVHILAQVAGALQEAHDRGLIHRDIKPANIMLCMRGGVPDVVKVVDFGLAKKFTDSSGASTQVILGTPKYLSPEAIHDPSRVGPASDLYALGAVGYFLLTGRPVFEGKTDVDLIVKHMMTPPTPPSTYAKMSPALEAVILRCLEKTPEARYASATELADALRAASTADAWSDGDARTWWSARRVDELARPATTEATITISVDLGARHA